MKIGASNGYLIKNFGVQESIEILSKAGFDSIDYSLSANDEITDYKLFAEYTDQEFDKYFLSLKTFMDERNIMVGQTHAHDQWYITEYNDKLGIKDDFYRTAKGRFEFNSSQRYIDLMVKCIRATSILGSKYVIIHPLILPSYKYDNNREECKKYNMEIYSRLIPYLEKYDVKVGVENMFTWAPEITQTHQYCPTSCSRPEEIIDYIQTLNSDRFVACLDLGHLNLTCKDTNDTVDGGVLKLHKYLKTLHVHDTDGFEDLHVPPFMGNIDWVKVCKALKEVDYKGVFNFEIGGGYFNKFGKENIQFSADYLYSTGKFLTKLMGK